jgi:hypothetical protein
MSPVEHNADGELVWDAREEPAERCVPIPLEDGSVMVVRGSSDWTDRERELFTSLAVAAQRMAARERAAREQLDVETDQ